MINHIELFTKDGPYYLYNKYGGNFNNNARLDEGEKAITIRSTRGKKVNTGRSKCVFSMA